VPGEEVEDIDDTVEVRVAEQVGLARAEVLRPRQGEPLVAVGEVDRSITVEVEDGRVGPRHDLLDEHVEIADVADAVAVEVALADPACARKPRCGQDGDERDDGMASFHDVAPSRVPPGPGRTTADRAASRWRPSSCTNTPEPREQLSEDRSVLGGECACRQHVDADGAS
jgi:hypothetical protein